MDYEKELNNMSTKWIENLALEEINMEETGVVSFNDHIDPALNLEEASIELMEEIRELFEIYLTKFNNYRSDHTNNKSIKMFKISNTVNDFMLFRNSLKLVISRVGSDVIRLGFVSNTGSYFPSRPKVSSSQVSSNSTHEIRAQVGPFNDIKWTFQGDPVDIHALTKFYLTDFIRQSAT